MIRLTLAALVAIVHANAVGWHDQPQIGQTQIGELAVDGFFVVSGFLVTRSALRLPSLRRYAWHRMLRIMPGFWVCLLVGAFVVAPLIAWLQGRSPAVVLSGDESSFGYVANNVTLLMRQWDVAGLLGEGREAALNGSLWTLWYEAVCYVAVAVLIAVVPVAWRRAAVAAFVGAVWLFVAATDAGLVGPGTGPEYLPRFLLLFGLGALGWLFADRIRFAPSLLVLGAAGLVVGLLEFADYRVVGAVGFAYLLLWATVALPVRIEPRADISYGLYVYHWPVEQVLVAAGATALGLQAFTLLALCVAGGLALASWHWVERPALARKNAAWVDAVPLRARLLRARS